ncbi:hypothetical protein PoB_001241400 [Plakobranchus ocellatus]|uniref:Uncharacterized protein n=1 Tax=Plakobranchus ocellatus TaxID=259542 RepID=A0AAV3YV48_9GAST|nr:hypothetical protein PoB_001241400 [Plakobranchus ocellatus]
MSKQEKYTIKNNQVELVPFIDRVKKVREAAAQETRAWLEERQRNTNQANKEVLCRNAGRFPTLNLSLALDGPVFTQTSDDTPAALKFILHFQAPQAAKVPF